MSAWQKIVDKAFSGNTKVAKGNPNCIIKAGVPNTDESVSIGTLCWDSTNSDAYITTDTSGTWVKINA